MERNKFLKKIKNKFECNKLILYVYSNFFFVSFYYIRTKKIKNMKILRNFDYILFSFTFSMMKLNIIKSFSLVFFLFS